MSNLSGPRSIGSRVEKPKWTLAEIPLILSLIVVWIVVVVVVLSVIALIVMLCWWAIAQLAATL